MAVRLKGPRGCSSTLGYQGETYEADEDDVFTVPDTAAPDLEAHGFKVAPPVDKKIKTKKDDQ